MNTNLTLAEHYLNIKQPQKALEVLEKSGGDLDSVDVWRIRMQAFYDLDHYPEALKSAYKGLELEPDNIQLLYVLCKIQAQLKNLADAETAILTALDLSPENPTLLAQYAILLSQAGQSSKAQKVVNQAILISPEEPSVINAQMIVSLVKGDTKKVQAYSQALLRDNPDNAFGHYMLGQSFSGKQSHTASKHFRTAASLAPENKTIIDTARESRYITHPLMWPLYPILRFGRIPFWLTCIAIMLTLGALGWETAAGICVIVYFLIVIYSWTVPRMLRWYLKYKGKL